MNLVQYSNGALVSHENHNKQVNESQAARDPELLVNPFANLQAAAATEAPTAAPSKSKASADKSAQ